MASGPTTVDRAKSTERIELHIEQARLLQDTQNRIGVVNAIAGYVHADITIHGRGDHAGATPMDFREDAGLVMAECMLELERLAKEAAEGTVGEIELRPNFINAVPGQARFPLDIRGVVAALEEAAEASGEPYMSMHSGAAHDTMSIADRVPSAMVFVPCKDGISHSPEEDADPADAALGAEIMLNAIKAFVAEVD
jgi:allantoate deiminase